MIKQVHINMCPILDGYGVMAVLNCNFSKEQSVLPDDDRMIEICRSVLM